MKKTYTVSEVNSYISRVLSDEDFLSCISVSGEVSNVKYHSSGHIYFTLKDRSSVLPAVMFRSNARTGLSFRMKDGDQVTVTGSVEVYKAGGRYQLYAKKIEAAGEGDLYRRFEELKKALSEMGMFAEEYKKPLAPYAMKIGVVTAPTGAVIHDIIRNARRRNPYVSILLCPVKVQGEGAAEEIAEGIARLDPLGLDAIIVGRGGGSMEDLWAFNEEVVARQIFASQTPIITGIGHEPDVTIADYVADRRASTPTAAAELAVFSYDELKNELSAFRAEEEAAIRSAIDRNRRLLEQKGNTLLRLSPDHRVKEFYGRLDEKADRLNAVMEARISAAKQKIILVKDRPGALMESHISAAKQRIILVKDRPGELFDRRLTERKAALSKAAALLDGTSPLKKLASGYSYVTDESGRNVQKTDDVKIGDRLTIRLYEGKILADVVETEEN